MKLLRYILFPISLVYALVVKLRNLLYDIGIFKAVSFDTKIICIGNLSVGGTGKTPMVEYLIRQLNEHHKLAVVSRGYKRTSKGYLQAAPTSTVTELGDEPFQIYTKFPEVCVVVDADRRNGIKMLEKQGGIDLILLDDAFQHRKVKAGFNILLTAFDNRYNNDWYLPTGNLRDSRSEAKRADVIIVTKCPDTLNDAEMTLITNQIKRTPNQKVLFAGLAYNQTIRNEHKNEQLSFFKNKEVTLVTGIANPKPLVTYLTDSGLQFEHLEYPDHHFFSKTELQTLSQKKLIVTTEKDFVRLEGKLPNLYYIQIQHQFLKDGEAVLDNLLSDFIK